MHLYKHFFKLLSRNKNGLIIYSVISVIMFVILVFSASNTQGRQGVSVEAISYDISYVDADNTILSKGLVDYLSDSNSMKDYSDKDENEISNLVFFAITDFYITIPEGFASNVEAGNTSNGIEYETANGNMSYVSYDIESQINNFLNTYKSFRTIGLDENEAIAKTNETLSVKTQITLVADEDEVVNVTKSDIVVFNLNQYFPYIILGLMSLGVGNTIMLTNKKELAERNAVSPIPGYMTKLTSTLGLLTTGIAFWFIYIVIIFIYGSNSEILSNFGLEIVINSLLCTLISCAIASLLTSFIKSGNTLSMVTNIVGLSMAFLCGVFVPMRFIGENVLSFSKFLPFYWAIYANNMTSSIQSAYAYNSKDMLTCFAVEILFVVAISTVAIICNTKRIIKE